MSPISLEFITTDDRCRRLCECYWEITPDGDFVRPVRDVAREFGIKQHLIIPLVNEGCTAQVIDATCARCKEKKSPVLRTRTEFAQYQSAQRNGGAWVCHECHRKAEEALREQRAAQAAQRAEVERLERDRLAAQEQRRREAVRAGFAPPSQKREPVDPLSLSLKRAVWLLSLVRLGASEDLSSIGSCASLSGPLSGNPEQDIEILRSLYKCRFIHVDPESPLNAFEFVEDKTDAFFLDKVRWTLSDQEHADYARAMVEDLESMFRKRRWVSRWHDDLLPLWREIVLQDCLEFLRVELEEHGFELNPGEKTTLVLRGALEEYSPGQVYNMIWRATRDAASFYMKGGVNIRHAANTVPGAIQRYADRARADRSSVKVFWRSRKCAQSMISQVFFDLVLQIGDGSMSTVPYDWDPSASDDSGDGQGDEG